MNLKTVGTNLIFTTCEFTVSKNRFVRFKSISSESLIDGNLKCKMKKI